MYSTVLFQCPLLNFGHLWYLSTRKFKSFWYDSDVDWRQKALSPKDPHRHDPLKKYSNLFPAQAKSISAIASTSINSIQHQQPTSNQPTYPTTPLRLRYSTTPARRNHVFSIPPAFRAAMLVSPPTLDIAPTIMPKPPRCRRPPSHPQDVALPGRASARRQRPRRS